MNDAPLDVGLVSLAALVIAGGRAQEEILPPQGPQIEIQAALAVDKQRAAALSLEHSLAVCSLQGKVFRLHIEVARMRLGTPKRPTAEPSEGQLREQLVQMGHHRTQPPRGLR